MDQETPLTTPASRSLLNPPQEKKIQFTQLSEGLGFHPFADGLPYAPVTRAQRPAPPVASALSMGSGAIAAGRPMPVPQGKGPVAAPPRVSVPVAQTAYPAPKAPLVAGIAVPQMTARASTQESFGFGYMLKRIFAYLIDLVTNTTLCVVAFGAVMVRLELTWDSFANPNVLLLSGLFLALFNWAIVTAQEVVLRTTLGKRMFGLVLRGDTSALFLRAFFFLPSVFFGGLGLVWAIFDRRRRCWHDHAVDAQPLELAQL